MGKKYFIGFTNGSMYLNSKGEHYVDNNAAKFLTNYTVADDSGLVGALEEIISEGNKKRKMNILLGPSFQPLTKDRINLVKSYLPKANISEYKKD